MWVSFVADFCFNPLENKMYRYEWVHLYVYYSVNQTIPLVYMGLNMGDREWRNVELMNFRKNMQDVYMIKRMEVHYFWDYVMEGSVRVRR